MTFLRKDKIPGIGKRSRTIYVFSCDECGIEFTSSKDRRKRNCLALSFCSVKCANFSQKKGGTLSQLMATPKYNESKYRQTMITRYGSLGGFANKDITNKIRQTMLERYGTTFPQRLDVTKEKMKLTNISKWGHECSIHATEISSKIDRVELTRKAFETKRKRGLLFSSHPENRVRDVLIKLFGMNDIKIHPWFNKWLMDFFIISLNIYVQVDGVYWHGLNVPIEEIKKDSTPYKKWIKDREQDMWIADQYEIRLVRITDVEINECRSDHDLQLKLEKLCK